MPELPVARRGDDEIAALPVAERTLDRADLSPYLRIAEDLRGAIRCGVLATGAFLPTGKELATRYSVSVATAHRALAVLTCTGEVIASRGRRATVAGHIADTDSNQIRGCVAEPPLRSAAADEDLVGKT
jgi:DNA-binding GntR family transcriptional regulator